VEQVQAAGVSEDKAEVAVNAIEDRPARAWGQLALFRARLAATKGVADHAEADKVDPRSVAHQLARQELARHNTRRDGGFANVVKNWDDLERAFGSLGVAQGMQKGK
jgi:hypothetical protein